MATVIPASTIRAGTSIAGGWAAGLAGGSTGSWALGHTGAYLGALAAGPPGALMGSIAGAIIGAFSGGLAGGTLGSATGDLVAEKGLETLVGSTIDFEDALEATEAWEQIQVDWPDQMEEDNVLELLFGLDS